MNKERLVAKIADRARDYNWDTQAAYVERLGKCPDGWGHEVGQNVALFMTPPPLSGLLQGRIAYQEERENDIAHGHKLAELRLWIAKLNTLNSPRKVNR